MYTVALLMAVLAMAPMQDPATEMITLYDMGTITFDPTIVPPIDTERLYELTKFTFGFIEGRCVPPCELPIEILDLDINVVSYGVMEDYLLGVLDNLDPMVAAQIRGDQAYFEAFTAHIPQQRTTMYFNQYPVDTLMIHELLHVVYPLLDENTIRQRQAEMLASRLYKDWLRSNY